MVRAMLTMVVHPGCEAEFERIWRAAVLEPGDLPGSLGQALTYDPAMRAYIITADWESRDALAAFEQSPQRRALSEALIPLRESASKSVLEIVARR
jgi:heme-degrading monooxygenase HmoA